MKRFYQVSIFLSLILAISISTVLADSNDQSMVGEVAEDSQSSWIIIPTDASKKEMESSIAL